MATAKRKTKRKTAKRTASRPNGQIAYTAARARLLCALISNAKRPMCLREVLALKHPELPWSYETVRAWRNAHPDFDRAFLEARKAYCLNREEEDTQLIDQLVRDASDLVPESEIREKDLNPLEVEAMAKARMAGITAREKALKLRAYHNREYAKVHYREHYGDKVEVTGKGFVPIKTAPMGAPPPGAAPEDVARFADGQGKTDQG